MGYQVKTYESAEIVSRDAARQCLRLISANVVGRPFVIALSGGRSIQGFFQEIVKQAREGSVDMSSVVFCWADERCVPPDDVESNFKMANEQLFQPLGIREDHIIRIEGELDPSVAAVNSQHLLNAKAASRNEECGQPIIDLVVLGTGEDGHVASLFPGASEETDNSPETFIPVIGPKPPPQRVTLTYAAIKAATHVWVLVLGAAKADALTVATSDKPTNPLGKVLSTRSSSEVFTDLAVDL